MLKVVSDDSLDRSVSRVFRKGPACAKEGRQDWQEWKVRMLVRLEFGDTSIYGDTENEDTENECEREATLVMLWNFTLSSYKEHLRGLLRVLEG